MFKSVIRSTAVLLAVGAAAWPLQAAEEFVPGYLRMEKFNGITGTAVSALTADPDFMANNPDEVLYLGAGFTTGINIDDNFGARVSGFVVPPADGSYRFYIRSDDASQLFISSDDSPANLGTVPIAEETGCCQAFLAPPAAQTSEPIALVGGQRYYIEGLYKEGGGGDFLQVAAALDGDATPTAPIPVEFLGVMYDPALSSVTITDHPQDTTIVENTTATLSVVATGSPAPIGYQWQRNEVDIEGATSSTYTTQVLGLGDDASYRCVVSVIGLSVPSDAAEVTVTGDTSPPEVVSIGSLLNPSGNWQVSVTFNKLVDSVSAGDQANYSISGGTITGAEFYENAGEHIPGQVSQAAVLTVTGLTAGSDYDLTISGVKDATAAGNEMDPATRSFRAANLTWANIGDHQGPSTVTAVGSGGFDIESSGRAQWAQYDETTLVYREVEGDWDFKAQVIDQDFSSQWARAGLMFREGLDLDATREANNSVSRYMTAHANPVTKTSNDTTPETRTLDVNGGNNGFESNARVTTGEATVGAGGGGPLAYPDTWVRLQRLGSTVTAFWSKSGGMSWTQLASRTYDPPLADTLFVGPSFSPETANITGGGFESYLFLAQIRNFAELPIISSTPANGAVFVDAGTTFTVRVRSNVGVPQANVAIAFQGVDRTGEFTASGSDNDRTFSFTGNLAANTIYQVDVALTDSENTESTSTIRFDTFSQNNFTWEAEDFNFEGGSWWDEPILLCNTLGGEDQCYFDKVGVEGIDEHDIDGGGPAPDLLYRFGSATATEREEMVGTEPTADFLRQKYVDAGISDYNVGWVAVSEWLNYTRTFPAGTYNVYARLARDGGSEILFTNELSRLTTPTATTANQTTEVLGTFGRSGTGGWQSYVWVPLLDESGNLVPVTLDGVTTLRATCTAGGYNANFYMLIPAAAVGPELTVNQAGGTVTLGWSGTGFVLESKGSLGDPEWSSETTTGNQLEITPATGETKFYRLRQE